MSWRRLSEAWISLSGLATSTQNWERLALAEAKLEQCRLEIERLEKLLGQEVSS